MEVVVPKESFPPGSHLQPHVLKSKAGSATTEVGGTSHEQRQCIGEDCSNDPALGFMRFICTSLNRAF